jgi:hypothetical protein
MLCQKINKVCELTEVASVSLFYVYESLVNLGAKRPEMNLLG